MIYWSMNSAVESGDQWTFDIPSLLSAVACRRGSGQTAGRLVRYNEARQWADGRNWLRTGPALLQRAAC